MTYGYCDYGKSCLCSLWRVSIEAFIGCMCGLDVIALLSVLVFV